MYIDSVRMQSFLKQRRIECSIVFVIFVVCVIYALNRSNLVVSRSSSSAKTSDLRPRMYDYKGAMAELNREKVTQDDPRLIQIIRDHYILPPSTEAYNLVQPNMPDVSYFGVSKKRIEKNLNNKTGGFFIECGAFDGELKSTSLYFERQKHWKGLLIEADPVSFARLRYKNRKAYMMNACLSTTSYPTVMSFNMIGESGRVLDGDSANSYLQKIGNNRNFIQVQCFPLYSILLALNQFEVDFFTLDIEGAELDVLKTVPLDKVNIDVMLVEHFHITKGLIALRQHLEKNGYKTLEVLRDDIIVKKQSKHS